MIARFRGDDQETNGIRGPREGKWIGFIRGATLRSFIEATTTVSELLSHGKTLSANPVFSYKHPIYGELVHLVYLRRHS